MKKILICTIVAILLDISAIGILLWLAMQSVNLLLWGILAFVSLTFIYDIRNAIWFFQDYKRFSNLK